MADHSLDVEELMPEQGYAVVDRSRKWLEQKVNLVLVIASFVAAASYQAGMSPPRGYWQDDMDGVFTKWQNGLVKHDDMAH